MRHLIWDCVLTVTIQSRACEWRESSSQTVITVSPLQESLRLKMQEVDSYGWFVERITAFVLQRWFRVRIVRGLYRWERTRLMVGLFWDIESYDNFFCVGLYDENNELEMYYLVKKGAEALAVKKRARTQVETSCFSNIASRTLHGYCGIPATHWVCAPLLSQFLGTKVSCETQRRLVLLYNGLSKDIQMMNYFESTVVAGRTQTTPKQIRGWSQIV